MISQRNLEWKGASRSPEVSGICRIRGVLRWVVNHKPESWFMRHVRSMSWGTVLWYKQSHCIFKSKKGSPKQLDANLDEGVKPSQAWGLMQLLWLPWPWHSRSRTLCIFIHSGEEVLLFHFASATVLCIAELPTHFGNSEEFHRWFVALITGECWRKKKQKPQVLCMQHFICMADSQVLMRWKEAAWEHSFLKH